MKISYLKHVKSDRFAFAKEEESGKYCISIPVSNGMVEYNEYYEISEVEYKLFSTDLDSARSFVEDCRNRKQDGRLMQKPGRIRGEPL
ncbi:MAG: hypothetical protein HRU19_30230 [Pseudobacteriovorax sp.]|nr:hypothetical protein [Pseudobacteriovorax sp.]